MEDSQEGVKAGSLRELYSCAREAQRGQATSPKTQSGGSEKPPTRCGTRSRQPNKDPPCSQVRSSLIWA